MAKPPIETGNAVLVFSNNRIIACNEDGCWEYNPHNNVWVKLVKASFENLNQPGVVLDNKLYIVSHYRVKILDLMTNYWSTGPKPPIIFGPGPSIVGWKDLVIVLGGSYSDMVVQVFNVTSQTWIIQSSDNVTMKMDWSSSLLIGENEILIVGSDKSSFHHSAAIYNPETNSWTSLPDSKVNHKGSRLVKLGSRIFAIDGRDTDTVEEFFATNATWSLIGLKPINKYDGYHSIVAVPASLFTHLPRGCKGVL